MAAKAATQAISKGGKAQRKPLRIIRFSFERHQKCEKSF
jgi:hypothetical protein